MIEDIVRESQLIQLNQPFVENIFKLKDIGLLR